MRKFLQKHQVLWVLLTLLLFLVIVMITLIAAEMKEQHITVDKLFGAFWKQDTNSDSACVTQVSETAAVTQNTETEPPPPYYTAESDRMYFPGEHTGEAVPAEYAADAEYRIYTALPQTDSEGFNDYCRSTVSSLATAVKAQDTLREGGCTAVSIDYILHTAQHVYSAALIRTQYTETENDILQAKDVTVLIYDTEAGEVYAPLDRYDMEAACEALTALMQNAFQNAFALCGLEADRAFIDTVCTNDPSSFVNIAADDDNLYFYRVYEGAETTYPVLLCAAVSYADLACYTWEAIAAAQMGESATSEETTEPPIVIPPYDTSGAVLESEAVGDDYFDDALFIGNSLIVGLQKAVTLKATYFASVGLSVSHVFTEETVLLSDGTYATVSDALETVSFQKVYLMFGVNELGWGSITSFVQYYGKLIDRIREVNADAVIYVQSLLPINEEKWAQSKEYRSYVNNVSAATFNGKIAEMCKEKSVYFVNVAEVMTDETGNLFKEATGDGVHINAAYSEKWITYLKTHTVLTNE